MTKIQFKKLIKDLEKQFPDVRLDNVNENTVEIYMSPEYPVLRLGYSDSDKECYLCFNVQALPLHVIMFFSFMLNYAEVLVADVYYVDRKGVFFMGTEAEHSYFNDLEDLFGNKHEILEEELNIVGTSKLLIKSQIFFSIDEKDKAIRFLYRMDRKDVNFVH